MRITNATLHAALGAALLIVWPAASSRVQTAPDVTPITEDGFRVMRDFFAYDESIPLEARIVDRDEYPGYVREKIVLRGIRDSAVPGYLAIPTGDAAGPYPCAILMHGIGGSKEDWWNDNSFSSGGLLTQALLASGCAVLTLDAEYHGERAAGNNFESPEVFVFQHQWIYRARNMIVDSVIEHRRAIDYLGERPEIDAARIGLVGYSMGGLMAFQLSAVDPRIRASIACVSPLIKEPAASALGIHNFAPFIEDTTMLMMIGRDDQWNYSVADAQAVHALLPGDDHAFEIFESGHKLPATWTARAATWMHDRLR